MKFHIILLSFVFFLSCKKTESNTPAPVNPAITAIDCSAASAGTMPVAGISYNGTVMVPYTGGNGKSYSAGSSIASTGVTGLFAILQAGTLATGSGNFQYNITGTPSSAGNAVFNISFDGTSCSISIPVNEAPLVQYGTPFANVTDRQDATIYQVNIRTFSTQGNLQGIIPRLDSIKALGANVIYLMPIYPVGIVRAFNSPYCIRDYKSVNPEFGSLADLRALVNAAHSRNMSVILDWVANHTSWDHSWITNHSDWYLKDGSGNIVNPPGQSWSDVAQLNFNNAAMRLEMINSMKYWIYTANVDGYRCDYADGPTFQFWKQAVDSLRNISTHKLLLLAEGSRSDHFTAGFDFTFGFNFYGGLKNIINNNQSATNIDGLNNSEYTNASNGQQVVRYITNHDVNGSDGTPQEVFGGIRSSFAGFVIAAYMKGVPMIYNGQEVALPYRLTFPFTGANIDWSLNPEVTSEYKKLVAFRNSSAAIRRGQLISYTTTDVCAFTKQLNTAKVFVASNIRNANITYILPAGVANTTWTNAMTGASVSLTSSISLQPYEYVVLKK